jgi:solute carrier family 41
MVFWMWGRGTDPDNSAIPYLTALGDLLGGAFLGLAFLFLSLLGAKEFQSDDDLVVSSTASSLNMTRLAV